LDKNDFLLKSKYPLSSFMYRDVLDKIDEETMPDYGQSKNYKLLPHFSDDLESNN